MDKPLYELVWTRPDGRQETLPLRGGLVLGRDTDEPAFPGDKYLSGRHAVVDVRGDEVVLEDLGSRNGTFLRVDAEIELRHGDVFSVGRRLFRFLE